MSIRTDTTRHQRTDISVGQSAVGVVGVGINTLLVETGNSGVTDPVLPSDDGSRKQWGSTDTTDTIALPPAISSVRWCRLVSP